jgi:hypothetical protein
LFVVEFQTLFLGIVFGLWPVRVAVSPPVTSVEIVLDGTAAGVVAGQPWTLQCDFGPPKPHELVAIGRNSNGEEVTRVRQWVNLPKPPAVAQLFVESAGANRPFGRARLSWNTLSAARAKNIRVWLDGQELRVKDPEAIELPACDAKTAHLLSAEISFADGSIARAETAFGGEVSGGAQSELTAVPIVVREGATLPPAGAMTGWFFDRGKPVRVIAVDEGLEDVVVVFDQDVLERFRGLTPVRRSTSTIVRSEGTLQASRGGNRLFVMYAVPKVIRSPGNEVRSLFPCSVPMTLDPSELAWAIFNLAFSAAKPEEEALANAVATAGLQAAAVNRRRAVVLLVGEANPDRSTISVEAARVFLQSINVPLFIWCPDPRIARTDLPGWGRPREVSTDLLFFGAFARLQTSLQAQRIVWLEGSHLPQNITLATDVKQAFLARGVVRN